MVKKLPRWQREQQERQSQKKRRFIRLFMLSVILFLLAGAVWRIYKLVKGGIWDGRSQINFVIQSSPVMLTSFNPSAPLLNILIIPQGTFIETIHGYGPYRVESIYPLGELEKHGGELLLGSLQEYFKVPVDAYILTQNSKLPSARVHFESSLRGVQGEGKAQNSKEIKSWLSGELFALLKNGGKNNLARWDLLRLWWTIREIREDKINLVDLGQTSASGEVFLVDGSKAIKIDAERAEQVIQRYFSETDIRQEGLSVVVLNGTDHPGLATRGVKLIKNIGGRVVGVGELASSTDDEKRAEIAQTKCQIRSQKKYKNSSIVRRLAKVFDCDWGGENLENQRAEVVIILGENYWQRLNFP